MNHQKQIEDLNHLVNEYYKCNLSDGDKLTTLHQKITGILYYLETLRAEVHDAFQSSIYELVKEKKSVARAENESHVKYPEMYQLRRVMDAGWRVADSIRTNISYLKNERNSSKSSNN